MAAKFEAVFTSGGPHGRRQMAFEKVSEAELPWP
jgi:hypothetical protein